MSNSLEWAEIAARLASARSYWLVTASERGVPHATPVWGAVLDGVLYLYTDRQSVKARNLAENPRLVVHLESGEDVLIVHGTAEDAGHPAKRRGCWRRCAPSTTSRRTPPTSPRPTRPSTPCTR